MERTRKLPRLLASLGLALGVGLGGSAAAIEEYISEHDNRPRATIVVGEQVTPEKTENVDIEKTIISDITKGIREQNEIYDTLLEMGASPHSGTYTHEELLELAVEIQTLIDFNEEWGNKTFAEIEQFAAEVMLLKDLIPALESGLRVFPHPYPEYLADDIVYYFENIENYQNMTLSEATSIYNEQIAEQDEQLDYRSHRQKILEERSSDQKIKPSLIR